MFYTVTSIKVKHAVKIVLYYLETKATKDSYVELVLFSFCHTGGPLRYKLPLLFFIRDDCTKGTALCTLYRQALGGKKSLI